MPSWAPLPSLCAQGLTRVAVALLSLATFAGLAIGLAGPAVGGAHGTLTFDGRLTLNGTPAPGQEIVVLAGPELRLLEVCGRATSAAGGHYTVTVDDKPGCTDEGNKGGPVSFIFAWKGQKVGGVSVHFGSLPGHADLIVENLNIYIPYHLFTLETLPWSLATYSTVAQNDLLVPRRYYGIVEVHGNVPHDDMQVQVKNGSYPCGRGEVHAGKFFVDIDIDSQCASPRAGSGWKAVTLTFLIDGRELWRTSVKLIHELPATLGRSTPAATMAANWLPR